MKLRFHCKRKNRNFKGVRLWVWQIFLLELESISAWIKINVLSLNAYEANWLLLDIFLFFKMTHCLTAFVLFFNRLHSAILLANETIYFFCASNFLPSFFSIPKRKKNSSTRTINREERNIFLSTENFLKWTPAFGGYLFSKVIKCMEKLNSRRNKWIE